MLTPVVWAMLFGIAGALLIGPFGAIARRHDGRHARLGYSTGRLTC